MTIKSKSGGSELKGDSVRTENEMIKEMAWQSKEQKIFIYISHIYLYGFCPHSLGEIFK